MQKLLTFFGKSISVYAIFNNLSFNNMLTNNIVSFEQLGPEKYQYSLTEKQNALSIAVLFYVY